MLLFLFAFFLFSLFFSYSLLVFPLLFVRFLHLRCKLHLKLISLLKTRLLNGVSVEHKKNLFVALVSNVNVVLPHSVSCINLYIAPTQTDPLLTRMYCEPRELTGFVVHVH